VRLPDRAEFRDQQKIAMKYKLGKIDLVDSFSVHLSDWEIMMNEGAMFNTGADLHRAEVKIYVAQRVSKVIEALVSKSRQVGKLLDKVIGGSNASLRSIKSEKQYSSTVAEQGGIITGKRGRNP